MSYYLSYNTLSSLGEFVPGTVHSDTSHNNPHSRLITNDINLDTQLHSVSDNVSTLQSDVAALQAAPATGRVVRFTPSMVLMANNVAFGIDDGMVPEWNFSVVYGITYHKIWQTHTYPWFLPYSGVSGVLVQAAVWTTSSTSCYIKVKSTSCPEFTAAYSRSRANSDDGASDTNEFEIPYEGSRIFQTYYSAVWGNGFALTVNVVGYRT